VDYGICFCLIMSKIDQALLDPRAAGYDIKDMGDVNDCLRVNFESLSGGRVKLYQPHLIGAIMRDVGLTPKDSTRRYQGQQTMLGRDLTLPVFLPAVISKKRGRLSSVFDLSQYMLAVSCCFKG
jgi:hypothetical protein